MPSLGRGHAPHRRHACWQMIGEVATVIEMSADEVDIGKTIHPHPTLGESIGMAAEIAHGTCTDVPAQKIPCGNSLRCFGFIEP
jgi:hypothetical protein